MRSRLIFALSVLLALAWSAPARAARGKFTPEERAWRMFQPLRPVPVPEVKNREWPRTEIDRFILARLEREGLTPAPGAARETLARRAFFDTLGVPPSREELETFLNDDAPDAWGRLVDRLLADPRYGERQAQAWLDVARYAESDGYKQDDYREHAWRYRDWVIRAFNEDMPYGRFLSLQLAGDELEPDNPDALIATGFLTHGIYEYNNTNVAGQREVILNEITDTAADAFLGLGLQCARCHDHKFDPLLQKDYYRLQAVFAPLAERPDTPVLAPEAKREYEARLAEWEAATADVRAKIEALREPWREKTKREVVAKFPPEIQAVLEKPEEGRTPLESQIAALAWRQVTWQWDRLDAQIKGEDRAKLAELNRELAAFDSLKPPAPPRARTVCNSRAEPPPVLIPRREKEGEVSPGAPVIFGGEPFVLPDPARPAFGRRAALARWLARPENPLTARVIVNRVWQQRFGRGLHETPSDFGPNAGLPSHPELLDWLALRFMEDGWSLKKLHRLILTSAVWRQGSDSPSAELARVKDPENRLLWQWRARRLSAEEIRDAMLAASGELDPTPGGPGDDGGKSTRRSVYLKVLRNARDPLLMAFDFPERINSAPDRSVTTTATQALFLSNNPWVKDRAAAMSRALSRETPVVSAAGDFVPENAPTDWNALTENAWRRAAGRAPTEAEREETLAFLRDATDVTDEASREAAVLDLCHALLTSSALLYVE